MPTNGNRDPYRDVLKQIESGQAILFLGAGSTAQCTRPDGKAGLTGYGLAKEILLRLLGDGERLPFRDGQMPTLMEAAEYFQSNHPGKRNELDSFVQERLRGLRPTLAHYLAASFPWKAIVTTNYNTVAEDAWVEAANQGFAAHEVIVIRTDADIHQFAGETTKVRIYKPHGCVNLQRAPRHRMVLTSQDYAEAETIRKEIFAAIKSLAETSTTVFVGYSLADYTFRNLYYRLFLQLGCWSHQAYAVTPIESDTVFEWKANAMRDMSTTLVNTTFDGFMLRLVKARGFLHGELKKKVEHAWKEVSNANRPYLNGLQLRDVMKLSSTEVLDNRRKLRLGS